VQDALFDYDKSDIREDARHPHPQRDALKAILKDFPDAVIMVEGHCDERGSAEYNLASAIAVRHPPRTSWFSWAFPPTS